MARPAPDKRLSEIAEALVANGDLGITIFRTEGGWIANVKRSTGGFACGEPKASIEAAAACVLPGEPEAREDWEDLI